MLAQSFQTAAQLGLSDREHTALHRVLAVLEQDQLPHIKFYDVHTARNVIPFTAPGTQWFNMEVWIYEVANCGTAGCIGGWANHFAKEKVFEFPNAHRSLHQLFRGHLSGKSMRDITASEAASCLRHYLTTGIVDWKRACTH